MKIFERENKHAYLAYLCVVVLVYPGIGKYRWFTHTYILRYLVPTVFWSSECTNH